MQDFSKARSDYIGGLFPIALYARPLLRKDGESNLRFTVLLNPPEFRSHQDFHSEYLVLHDDKRIKDHFAMARIPEYTEEADHPMGKSAMLQAMRTNAGYSHLDSVDFVTEGYIVWEGSPPKTLSRGKDLLSRPALEKWLHGFFLKICLPFPRQTVSMSPVYSPLNLTAFLRLIAHLADIGYPAHWLSGILVDLCSGSAIKTTARAPQALITTPEHVDAASPQRAMSTAPWAAELSTLLSIWSSLLPFGLTAPRGHLVAPTDIAEYSVSFPHLKDGSQLQLPHFVLVFWNMKSPLPGGNRLHSILRQEGGMGEVKSDVIRIFTTLTFDDETKSVSFWSRADAMQKLWQEKEKGQWKSFIWRVDRWTQVTEGVKVSEGSVTMKRPWGAKAVVG